MILEGLNPTSVMIPVRIFRSVEANQVGGVHTCILVENE